MWQNIVVPCKVYIFSFLASLGLSLLLTPLVRRMSLSFGLVAKVRADRWHTTPTALFGGVAIFVSAMLVLAANYSALSSTKGFILAAAFIFLWGVLDDIFNLQPYVKLLGQVIAACIAFYFHSRQLYLWGSVFSLPIVIFWVIGITNAFNMLDNMDGLACGIANISLFFLFVDSLINGNHIIALITAILTGASLGFLPYNFNPARIFMGDGGSMFLGFSLAVMAVMGTTSAKQMSNVVVTVAVPILTMAVPIFDTTFVSIMRIIRGQSIIQGGKDHTSHRIVYLGFSVRKTVLLFYSISILLGGIALSFSILNRFVMTILALLSAIILIYLGFFLAEVKINDNDKIKKGKPVNNGKFTVFSGVVMHKRRIAEVSMDLVLVCIAYYTAFFLRFEGTSIFQASLYLISESLPLFILIKMSVFFFCGMYRGVWKYTSIYDFINIFKAVSIGSLLSIMAVAFLFRFRDYSRAVFFMDWLLLLCLLSFSRGMFRVMGEFFDRAIPGSTNIAIYGAGDMGELLLREIKRKRTLGYNPVCFIDDDAKKIKCRIHGIPILGNRGSLGQIIRSRMIQEVIVAIPYLDPLVFSEIAEICRECGARCHHINNILDKVDIDEF